MFKGYKKYARLDNPLSLNDLYFLNSDGQISEIKDQISEHLDMMRLK